MRIDGLQDAALFFLPFAVELVESAGDLAGSRGIFHAEEFDDVAGNVHAAGGVDARRDAKGNFAGGERSPVAELARLRAAPCSPGFTGERRPSSPSLAKTRFSPISGTASAMVAIATIFMNDISSRDWSASGEPPLDQAPAPA